METVQRITGGATGGMGYGVAAAAKEIGQLRDTIREAIEETVNQTLEEKLGGQDGNANEEHALAMRQLRDDNASHKKEIADLSGAINKLTEQIRELKRAQEEANKENQPPKASPAKRKKVEMKWTPGLEFNPKWNRNKKREYNKLFKENDPEGWKKVQLDMIERRKQALA